MSEEKTEQLILEVEKNIYFLISFDMTTDRAVASPTQPGGQKKIKWGQIFIIYFKV